MDRDEKAFQAFWAWTNHPSEEFARKAWNRILEGEPFPKDDPRFDPEDPGKLKYKPDPFSLAGWRRVVDRIS